MSQRMNGCVVALAGDSHHWERVTKTHLFKMKKFFIALLSITLSACATFTPPTNSDMENADYGKEINPDAFNLLVSGYLEGEVIDPTSLLYYGSTKTAKHWAWDSAGQVHYGYLGCFQYNAKNRMGGYVGKTKHCAFIVDGDVAQIYDLDRYDNFYPNVNRIDKVLTRVRSNGFSASQPSPTSGSQNPKSESTKTSTDDTRLIAWAQYVANANGCGSRGLKSQTAEGGNNIYEFDCTGKRVVVTCNFNGDISEWKGIPMRKRDTPPYYAEPACWM